MLSAAIDEIYLLRAGCAYEARANLATLEMRVPKKLVELLEAINVDLLFPAARGEACTLSPAQKVKVHQDVWETLHSLRANPVTGHDAASEDLYLAALDEIAALRSVLRSAAYRQRNALLFKTLSSSRRTIVKGQIDRMNAAAGGDLFEYRNRSSRVLTYALSEVGAADLLTLDGFRAELQARTRA